MNNPWIEVVQNGLPHNPEGSPTVNIVAIYPNRNLIGTHSGHFVAGDTSPENFVANQTQLCGGRIRTRDVSTQNPNNCGPENLVLALTDNFMEVELDPSVIAQGASTFRNQVRTGFV